MNQVMSYSQMPVAASSVRLDGHVAVKARPALALASFRSQPSRSAFVVLLNN